MTSTARCPIFKRRWPDLAAIQKKESAGKPLGGDDAGDDREAISPMTTLQQPVRSLRVRPGELTRTCCGLSSQLFTRLQPFNLVVRKWRASNLHSTDFSRRNKVRYIRDGKIPSLNRWEELFESAGAAWGNEHCEVNGMIIDGLPGMRNA